MNAPVIHHGDCIEVMRGMADNSIDAIVCDPPYGLEFMGKEWDAPWKAEGAHWREASRLPGSHSTNPTPRPQNFGKAGAPFQAWCLEWTIECLRVLKPGGHLLAFGGTRTWHRLACAVEDAGFEIRDSIAWLYGSGFPKSLDVSKAIDKAAGAEREVLGYKTTPDGKSYADRRPRNTDTDGWDRPWKADPETWSAQQMQTAPATDAARQWQGWGTAMKPAFEPVVCARKPLAKGMTVAANVIAHGTGALNIDACRIAHNEPEGRPSDGLHGKRSGIMGATVQRHRDTTSASTAGRWPANVALDEDQAAALDQMSGTLTSGKMQPTRPKGGNRSVYGQDAASGYTTMETYGDKGGASRFFYVAKAPAKERPKVDGIAHPTVKPVALMRWLIRLVTPPGGTVLDPFAGSGTTIEAAMLEGFTVIGIEREADYLPLIQARIDRNTYERPDDRYGVTPPGLFDLDGEASA